MAGISLNILQERELARLIDYERSTCTVNGELVYRCAFPYRPDDDLQRELIERRALSVQSDERSQRIVVISSDGYSYFLAKEQAENEKKAAVRRDRSLVGFSAAISVLCVVLGFLLGHFFA